MWQHKSRLNKKMWLLTWTRQKQTDVSKGHELNENVNKLQFPQSAKNTVTH